VVGTYAEAEHNGVGIIVGQGAQTVEFFLAGRVPEGKFYVDIVDEDVVDIIFWVASALDEVWECSWGDTKDGRFARDGNSG
jgi:hypothetical protein